MKRKFVFFKILKQANLYFKILVGKYYQNLS